MDQQFEHLSDAQIEHYGDRTGAGPNQPDSDQAMETHLSSCEACRARVLAFHRSRFGLMQGPNSTSPESATPDCPSEDTLRKLAVGLAAPADSAALMQHAAQCDHCGPILRAYTEDLSDELSAADQALLNQINSASASWQNKIARQMAQALSDSSAVSSVDAPAAPPGSPASPVLAGRGGQPLSAVRIPTSAQDRDEITTRVAEPRSTQTQVKPSWFHLPRLKWLLVPAGAIACALIAFFIWNLQRDTPEKVEKLLARAYTEQRTMDMRIPGAQYAPVRPQERGRDLNESPYLFEAKAVILRAIRSKRDDHEWLHALGREQLIEGRFEEAIATLRQGLQSEPQSADFMIDLAAAHYERARRTNNSDDYRAAIELLSKALKLQPDNPAAVFDRAILYGGMSPPLYESALQDWDHYLRIDPNSSWTEEAQRRKNEIEQLKKKLSLYKPLSFSDAESQKRADTPELLAENSLGQWLIEWGSSDPLPSSVVAINRLARDFMSKNGDYWLQDLLFTGNVSGPKTAVEHLGKAIVANQSGEPDEAFSEARKAEQIFYSLNSAGILRARYEEVYALHRQGHGKKCLNLALSLQQLLRQKNYPWLQVQAAFEASICRALTGDFGTAFRDIRTATDQATGAGMNTLALRGLGLNAELEATAGNDGAAWTLTQEGLQKLSSAPFTAMRGYQFYAGLAFSAEARKQWNVAVALNYEANHFVELTRNNSIQAMAHYRMAGDYLMAGDRVRAAEEFKISSALFAQLPQSDSWKAYRAYDELVLAGLEADHAQFARSRELLNDSETQLSPLTDYVIRLTYLKIRGDLEFKSNNFAAAKRAYISALDLGHVWLTSIKDDQDRLAWNGEMASVYRGLTRIYALHEHDPEAALKVWEEYRTIAIGLPLISDTGQVALAENDFLKSMHNQTLLTYLQFEDGIGIWTGDDRGVTFVWAPVPGTVMERKTKEFRALCADPRSDLRQLKLVAQDLYSILFKPVESRLEQRRTLLLDADTSLVGLPFSALQSTDNRYLIEKFTLISSPGLSFEQKFGHQDPIPISAREALIMVPAPPINDERDLLPLPDAVREAREVAAHFASHKLVIGTDATIDAFERYISMSNILHFAGHALFAGGKVGLVMSQSVQKDEDGDTLLLAETLEKVNLRHLRLVVLAACSTAGPWSSDVMSRQSITGAFLHSGVRNVVASEWDIDSATTRLYMNSFYESLGTGKQPADAIRAAALNLLYRPATRHPYHWAAFLAYGAN